MTEPAPRPGRLRRLLSGWSVRAMLAAVALMALALGWIESRVGPRRRAVRAILRAGGWVRYDWHYDGPVVGGGYHPWARPRAPGRLVELLGEDYFGDVVSASAGGGTLDGPLLDEIGRLRGLQALHLYGARLGRSDLARIAGLTGLRDLSLRHCTVDDEGLSLLAGLAGLEMLNLSHARINGPGLAHLAGMRNLQLLDVSWTPIDDRGLAHLPALPGLRVLMLDGTRVTDAGLAHLRALTGLFRLDLTRTRISDAGLEAVGAMPSLRLLALSDYGPDPHPTPVGVDALRRARPDMQVEFYETATPSPPRASAH